jgi:gluconolactonase
MRAIQYCPCFSIILLLAAIATVEGGEANKSPHAVQIIRLDSRFDRLVPHDTRIETIVSGHQWVEGPLWNIRGKFLLFSDIPRNAVFKWQEGNGVRLFLRASGYNGKTGFHGAEPGSNGLAYDLLGRLVLAQHGDRRIARLENDGRITQLVDRYQGKRLNSPNDLVFASNGDLYFTDPPFGLPKAFDDPTKELAYQGVYHLSKAGRLTLLINNLKAPNGIALSPNEKKLYVSDVDYERPAWHVYELRSDGTVTNGRIFADAGRWKKKPFFGPDGFKIDKEGNLFGARPGGISVFSPDGAHLGSIETSMPTSNVAWGDDGSTLYVTGGSVIFRLRLTTKGLGF